MPVLWRGRCCGGGPGAVVVVDHLGSWAWGSDDGSHPSAEAALLWDGIDGPLNLARGGLGRFFEVNRHNEIPSTVRVGAW